MSVTIRPDRLIVVADHTPGPHQTDTEETFFWRLPVLGPTASSLVLPRRSWLNVRVDWVQTMLSDGIQAKSSDLWRWAVIDNNPTPNVSPRVELERLTRSLTVPHWSSAVWGGATRG